MLISIFPSSGFLLLIVIVMFGLSLYGDWRSNLSLRGGSQDEYILVRFRSAEQPQHLSTSEDSLKDDSNSCNEQMVLSNPNKIEITSWNYGRLGNTVMSAINALTYAVQYDCDVLLPTTLQGINNYTSPRRHFCAQLVETHAAFNETDSETTSCQIKESSAYWWPKRRRGWDDLIRAQFQSYLGLNESHSFGHACPISSQEVCLGVHVRSGDVFRGFYDDVSGHWIPGEVHPGYEQPPLEYYLQAIRRFLDRHKGERKEDQGNNDVELNTLKKISVKVACEDNNNPVCEIFETMAHANPILEIVRADLLATLQTITCCEEIVLSRSTLSTVMTFSPRLRHLHHYTNNHSCSGESPRRYDMSSYFAVGHNITSAWRNTEAERHRMMQPYKMKTKTCYYRH